MHTREPPHTGHASDNNCFMGKAPRSIVNLISNRKTGYNLRGTNILSLPKVNTTRHSLTSFKYFAAKKMGHVARQYSIQGRHKRIYRMYSESKILKFTLDLGFTGIANIVNFNILV